MGYSNAYTHVSISTPPDSKDSTFSGTIDCSEGKYLSQCLVTASANQSCSDLTYIQCKFSVTSWS